MTTTIRVGTRASGLALAQTEAVAAALRKLAPDADVTIVTVKTAGDRDRNKPIPELGVGVFTKSLEEALLDGRIDLAVHSLKDLPTIIPDGLTVIPVLEREDPRDVLIDRWNKSLLELPEGACIGTSSPRRTAQLRHGRPDVRFVPMRGNVETRVGKLGADGIDGVVLAAAGLRRLGLEGYATEYLSPHVCTPAPGQGALAAELRATDASLMQLVERLVHQQTRAAVTAERELLIAAGAGCQVPIGGLAEPAEARTEQGRSGGLRLFANVTPLDGSTTYRVEVFGDSGAPKVLGRAAYQALLDQGAGPIMGVPQ